MKPTSRSPAGGSTSTGAIDQFGQVIDVLVSPTRDLASPADSSPAPSSTAPPAEVITDKAAVYPPVLEELVPGVWHHSERYANNPVEADHSRLRSWLRPMRGLKRLRSARVISAGHAFVQNIRRGHYELGIDEPTPQRVAAAFAELTPAI